MSTSLYLQVYIDELIEKINAYDIAFSKATEEEKLLIYCECDDIFSEHVYNNFYFHKFTSIITFCKTLRKICKDISNNYDDFEYDFPKHLSNNNFVIVIDGWKKIRVTNFPNTLNISKHRDNIEYYFGHSSGAINV